MLAAVTWTVVGTVLAVLAMIWVDRAGSSPSYLAIAFLLGYVKSRYVLDKTARRSSQRITERGDGKCIGGFFSYKSWLLVVVMASAGRFLRSGVVSILIVSFVYAAVGGGLIVSSRIFWMRYGEVVRARS